MDFGFTIFFSYNTKKFHNRNPRLKIIPCPFCNHPRTHYHGFYSRKGTNLWPALIKVLRYLCTLCCKTHSRLPDNLLPIIRWRLEHVQVIQIRFLNGHSICGISKSLSVSRTVINNLKVWLSLAPQKILQLTLAEGLIEIPPLKETLPVKLALPPTVDLPAKPYINHPTDKLSLTKLWPSWQAFAFTFSRAFYPKRFSLSPPHIILTG